MRKGFIVAVVVAQLLVLAYMAGEREWVLRSGKPVFLRTAPVDPRDPMRGDYVRFRYEIAMVPKKLCRDGVLTWFGTDNARYPHAKLDRRVYATIKVDRAGVAELIALSDRAPTDGLFLRGRVESVAMETIQVRFGVEALFMQQGKAREFEDVVRREKEGVPLNIEVAVSSRGLATIKGYRWEPLGITLQLDRPPREANVNPPVPRPGLRGVTVQLKNHSDHAVAVLVSDEARFFRLAAAQGFFDSEGLPRWEWTRAADAPPRPRPEEVQLLQPGETHRVHLDFGSPDWLVRKGASGPPTAITTLTEDWSASFRIEYAPPDEQECAGLPHAAEIHHARLPSRLFNAAGGAD